MANFWNVWRGGVSIRGISGSPCRITSVYTISDTGVNRETKIQPDTQTERSVSPAILLTQPAALKTN